MPHNTIVKRDALGKWLPGEVPNPGGRPKGISGYIKSITNDGKETVDFMLTIMHGKRVQGLNKDPSLYYRMDAAKWLFDKCFGSTPLITEEDMARGDVRRIVLIELEGKPADGTIRSQTTGQVVETEQLLQDPVQE